MIDKENKILRLTLKKKWFDMIRAGVKKEEYREIKPYWISRLFYDGFMLDAPINSRICVNEYEWRYPKKYSFIEFKNGYGKNAPTMMVEYKGLSKGNAVPEWSDNWQGEVFVIKLGKIIKST